MLILTLDIKGFALAILMGVALLSLGLGFGLFFVLTMLLFLVLSAFVTIDRTQLQEEAFWQGKRAQGRKNVLANGVPPLIAAVAFFVSAS